MKTMRIEKELSLAQPIARLQRVSIREGLQYKKEEEGIRAIGPLYVLGSYLDETGKEQTIREMIDMDVLAPAQKLSQEDFYIAIGEVVPQAREQTLQLEIELQIHGLKEETQEALSDEQAQPCDHDDTVKEEAEEETQEEGEDTLSLLDDCFDDLFAQEETTYTTCRLVVAKPNDTYAAIARRYEVDEQRLQACNHNREIIEKTLVILP